MELRLSCTNPSICSRYRSGNNEHVMNQTRNLHTTELACPCRHATGCAVAGCVKTWWHHQMETFSRLLALYACNSLVTLNSSHKGQWCRTLMFSLMYAWINSWVNKCEAGDLRHHCAHYDVIVMHFTTTRNLNDLNVVVVGPSTMNMNQNPHTTELACPYRHATGCAIAGCVKNVLF